ncbi:MAG TPA: hypothetical protein PK176_13870 [Acidobacteriota bacterium]|nr:hypothetical protein [Acidobacteriota bacterium]HQM64393.1 hypothetical protein [Acidobacteriota bacterium]
MIKAILSQLLLLLIVGLPTGFLLGVLMSWGFLKTSRRMDDPPSRLAQTMTVLLTLVLATALVGPLFSLTYSILFFRLFGYHAVWIYGMLVSLVLAVAMNLYAHYRRMRDLPVIVRMNLGAAFILGWLIPLLHFLFKR